MATSPNEWKIFEWDGKLQTNKLQQLGDWACNGMICNLKDIEIDLNKAIVTKFDFRYKLIVYFSKFVW